MLRYIKQYQFYITLFAFLLIPIIALDTSTRSPRNYKFHDKVIIGLTAPLQSLIHWTVEGAIEVGQNYLFLLNTRKENGQLLEENRKLLSTLASMRETALENERLRKLLDFRERLKIDTITARVIMRDVSSEFRAIRINRGAAAGIRKDMAVITHEGVVGRVLRVTENTADIITILDLLSAVDSVVERSRARGVVEGMTDDLCQLKFALRSDDIQVGDILISGGLGGIFPKGVPVGIVSKVNKKAFGISQEIEVRPSVDFSKLEEVLIVKNALLEPMGASLPDESASTIGGASK